MTGTGWLRAAVAGLTLAGLGSCAAPDAVPPAPPGPLAVFETSAPHGALPAPFDLLGLADDRSYVIIAQVPPPVAFDLSTAQAAQASLRQVIHEPWRIGRAGTRLGHVMAGWSCADGHRGLAAKTLTDADGMVAMVGDGWGLGAMLASFPIGDMVPLDHISAAHLAILTEGRGHLVAAEITAAQCAAMRDGLAAYLTHPDNPAGTYTLVGSPAEMRGDGCVGFALMLAGWSGAMGGVPDAMMRQVPLADSYVGVGSDLPEDATALPVERADGTCPGPVRALDLLNRDWDGGAALGSVAMADPELLFAALTALRADAGLRPGWHARRALAATDPAVSAAVEVTRDWARGWPVWRVERRGPLAALVLERQG